MTVKQLIMPALVMLCTFASCSAKESASAATNDNTKENTAMTQTAVTGPLYDIETSEGTIRVRLYDDTPAHRDNFARLVGENYYDNVLFHRVIKDFMVQTGDPESKNAPAGKMLGSGDPGYTLEAEIVYPRHFHKRGALAAARTGDEVNPERRSSGSQFYIVTGKKYNDQQLTQMEGQLAQHAIQDNFRRLAEQNRDRIMELRRNKDQAALSALQEELYVQANQEAAANPPRFTDEQRKAYTTVGGTPFLDNQYTVFGEVVSGMDVVDKIEAAATDRYDRPAEDIRIISVKPVKE